MISKFVTTAIAALVAAVALTLSTPVEAAQKQAKKKATATAKSPAHKAKRAKRVVRVVPARPSFGQLAGLRATDDALDLKSSVALVMDQDTNEVLLSKNLERGSADRVHHEADDCLGRDRGEPAARRDLDHLAGRRRYREGQPFAPARGHPAHA